MARPANRTPVLLVGPGSLLTVSTWGLGAQVEHHSSGPRSEVRKFALTHRRKGPKETPTQRETSDTHSLPESKQKARKPRDVGTSVTERRQRQPFGGKAVPFVEGRGGLRVQLFGLSSLWVLRPHRGVLDNSSGLFGPSAGRFRPIDP